MKKFILLMIAMMSFNSVWAAESVEKRLACDNVYQACLDATGIPKDQILMGVRGMCQDQQRLCETFQKQAQGCIKDYGLKACQRIFALPSKD